MQTTATVLEGRRLKAWSFAILGLLGALLGPMGLYAAASTFAAGTKWWVGVGFLASAPISVAGVVISGKEPRLPGAWFVSCLALFVFAVTWVLILVMKLA